MKENVEVLITLPFREDHLERLAKISPQFHLSQIRTWEQDDVPDEVWEKDDILNKEQELTKKE